MLRQPQYPAQQCPRCRTTLTNVQGVDTCPECAWVENAATR